MANPCLELRTRPNRWVRMWRTRFHSVYGVTAKSHTSVAPFRYRDRGSLATIGRKAAVAVFPGGIRLSGLIAWWTWLLVHIFFLIGFRNRITTMVDWMLAYITHQRHARLIFADTATRDAAQRRS